MSQGMILKTGNGHQDDTLDWHSHLYFPYLQWDNSCTLSWPCLFLHQNVHLTQKQNIHSVMRVLRSKTTLLISRPGKPEGLSGAVIIQCFCFFFPFCFVLNLLKSIIVIGSKVKFSTKEGALVWHMAMRTVSGLLVNLVYKTYCCYVKIAL